MIIEYAATAAAAPAADDRHDAQCHHRSGSGASERHHGAHRSGASDRHASDRARVAHAMIGDPGRDPAHHAGGGGHGLEPHAAGRGGRSVATATSRAATAVAGIGHHSHRHHSNQWGHHQHICFTSRAQVDPHILTYIHTYILSCCMHALHHANCCTVL